MTLPGMGYSLTPQHCLQANSGTELVGFSIKQGHQPKREYFYLQIDQGTAADNEITRIVIEDTVDGLGGPSYDTLNLGRLRYAQRK